MSIDMQERASVGLTYPGVRTVDSIMVENLVLPHHLGETLERHYTERLKIWGLVQLGNLLSVGEDLGKQVDIRDWRVENYEEFYLTIKTQCISVARDTPLSTKGRGTQTFARREEWEMENVHCHRYLYNPRLGTDGMWLYGEPGFSERPGLKHLPNTMMP